MTYQDWIAEAIAAKAGYTLPAEYTRKNGNDHTIQEEIPMRTAS